MESQNLNLTSEDVKSKAPPPPTPVLPQVSECALGEREWKRQKIEHSSGVAACINELGNAVGGSLNSAPKKVTMSLTYEL